MSEVVVVSCRAYRDAWNPCLTLLRRFWPGCPWPVRLVTDIDTSTDSETWFDPFEVGVGIPGAKSWGERLAVGLRDVDPRRIVLMLQEDFFLSDQADHVAILAAAHLMRESPDVGCFRLFPCPGPLDGVELGRVGEVPYGEMHRGEAYRTSCQASLWRAGYLRRLAALAGRPTDMELDGTVKACAWPERVLGVLRLAPRWPFRYICTAIVDGEWIPDALALCAREGIPISGTRKVRAKK